MDGLQVLAQAILSHRSHGCDRPLDRLGTATQTASRSTGESVGHTTSRQTEQQTQNAPAMANHGRRVLSV